VTRGHEVRISLGDAIDRDAADAFDRDPHRFAAMALLDGDEPREGADIVQIALFGVFELRRSLGDDREDGAGAEGVDEGDRPLAADRERHRRLGKKDPGAQREKGKCLVGGHGWLSSSRVELGHFSGWRRASQVRER